MDKDTRLKLAIQKSGRLTDHSLDLLGRCGLKLSRGKDQLMAFGENLPLDVLFVRDDDIPDLVQEDVCDLGLVGLNVLEERRLEMAARGASARFEILRQLDFGHCRLSLAVPEGMAWKDLSSIAGLRIATTYPALLANFLKENGIKAEIVTLSGAVEIAPRLGRADLICDLVSSGSTLQANHLREVHTILKSQVVLIRTPMKLPEFKEELDLAPAAAHRWRGAGEGEQVHHAARAALGAAADPRAAARQRIAHDHSARGLARQGGGARRVPRERVLGNPRKPEGRRCQRPAGAARRKDVELNIMLQTINWSELDADARRRALLRPRLESQQDVENLARSIIREVRKDGDAALLRFAERFDRAKLQSVQVTPRGVRCRRGHAQRRSRSPPSIRPSTTCGAFTLRSSARPSAWKSCRA